MSQTTSLGKSKPEKSDFTVDARGSACPGPLLETKKAIGKVPVNGILEIWSADPGSREDIPVWLEFAGHEYIGYIEEAGYDKHYVLRKK